MPNWTREHDAHIARECEGLEVIWVKDWGPNGDEPHIESLNRRDWLDPIPHYTTDANARDRAAEGWRRQVEGRSYETHSAVDDAFGHRAAWATCFSRPQQIAGSGDGEHALLWALWKATGGKE